MCEIMLVNEVDHHMLSFCPVCFHERCQIKEIMKEFVSSVQATSSYLEGEYQGILWTKLKHKGYDMSVVLYRMLIPQEIKTLHYRKLSA
jgi:hypothetical protein